MLAVSVRGGSAAENGGGGGGSGKHGSLVDSCTHPLSVSESILESIMWKKPALNGGKEFEGFWAKCMRARVCARPRGRWMRVRLYVGSF
jgi:hypothetical protein